MPSKQIKNCRISDIAALTHFFLTIRRQISVAKAHIVIRYCALESEITILLPRITTKVTRRFHNEVIAIIWINTGGIYVELL
jgi:hypothetical protein